MHDIAGSAAAYAARRRNRRRGSFMAALSSSRILIEISQVRRWLVLLLRHEQAVATDEVDLLVDGDIGVGFDAVVLLPRDVLGTPPVVLHHSPWPRQRVVDGGHLIVEDVGIGLVEIEALPDHGRV